MRVLRKVDESGLYIEDVLRKETEEIKEDERLIAEPIPEGLQLWHPKWNGTEWEEGLIQEEIDERMNQPVEPTALEKLRLETAQSNAELFEMMLMMSGGGL